MTGQQRARFTSFKNSTREDWLLIVKHYQEYQAGLADRMLDHLKLLDGDYGGFPVDRLQHSLQTATLAWEGDEDEEYVVCALLHDIGDTLGTYNHGEVAAAMLRPFVSEENHWMVQNHPVFQGYDYFHHIGMDRNAYLKFEGHPAFARTRRFCDLYDGPAFNPDATPKPLEFFEPMVRRVLAGPKSR